MSNKVVYPSDFDMFCERFVEAKQMLNKKTKIKCCITGETLMTIDRWIRDDNELEPILRELHRQLVTGVFRIEIIEISILVKEVKADSINDAINKLHNDYHNGDLIVMQDPETVYDIEYKHIVE